MLNFVAATDKEYVEPVAAMFHSLAMFNKNITLHLIHTNIGHYQLGLIEKAGKNFGAQFESYLLDPVLISALPVSGHLTEMTYARYFAPNIIDESIQRLVYLDSDIIVTDSLIELFEMDLGNSVVAATTDLDSMSSRMKSKLRLPEKTPYRNSGVLVIDPNEWRKQNFVKSILHYAIENKSKLWAADQCAFNAVMHERTSDLSPRFNAMPTPKYGMPIKNPAIIHLVGSPKPWNEIGTWTAFHAWHSQAAAGIPMNERVLPQPPILSGLRKFHEFRRYILGISGFRYHRRRLDRIHQLNTVSARLLVEAQKMEMESTQT